jgi:F0F1-type ATP synthase membrane subunit a
MTNMWLQFCALQLILKKYKTRQHLYAAPYVTLIWWVLIMNQIIIKPNIQTVPRHQTEARWNSSYIKKIMFQHHTDTITKE